MYDDAASSSASEPEREESGSASPVDKKTSSLDKEGSEQAVSTEVVPVSSSGGDGAISRGELKAVFRRAAWYSLMLTVIVAILGERTWRDFAAVDSP